MPHRAAATGEVVVVVVVVKADAKAKAKKNENSRRAAIVKLKIENEISVINFKTASSDQNKILYTLKIGVGTNARFSSSTSGYFDVPRSIPVPGTVGTYLTGT
jgi:hypothetical protein